MVSVKSRHPAFVRATPRPLKKALTRFKGVPDDPLLSSRSFASSKSATNRGPMASREEKCLAILARPSCTRPWRDGAGILRKGLNPARVAEQAIIDIPGIFSLSRSSRAIPFMTRNGTMEATRMVTRSSPPPGIRRPPGSRGPGQRPDRSPLPCAP